MNQFKLCVSQVGIWTRKTTAEHVTLFSHSRSHFCLFRLLMGYKSNWNQIDAKSLFGLNEINDYLGMVCFKEN